MKYSIEISLSLLPGDKNTYINWLNDIIFTLSAEIVPWSNILLSIPKSLKRARIIANPAKRLQNNQIVQI